MINERLKKTGRKLRDRSVCNNKTGYFRVHKMKKSNCKQGFVWRYSYYDDNGKRKSITSVDIKKLEKKLKQKVCFGKKYSFI
jgi:hypothetical protein